MERPSLHALADWPVASATAPTTVGDLLDDFETAGCRAYVCGGAVRDAITGAAINDVDLAVAAPLPRIREIVTRRLGADRVSDYLPRFGVLKLGTDGDAIDIAMLRTPDDVGTAPSLADVTYARIGSLVEDARNRDITINTGYWSLRDGLQDPLGCALAHVRDREFAIAADARKAAIDPRVSLRCLLFQARGYRMRPDARHYVVERLAQDLHTFGTGLAAYVQTLARGHATTAAEIARLAAGLVDAATADRLQQACAGVGTA